MWLRRFSQGAFLLAFVYLFLGAFHPLRRGLPPEIFLRLDPMASLATALATRQVTPELLLAAPMLIIALLLGRVFCGWACPLGTILDWTGGRRGPNVEAATGPSGKRSDRLILPAWMTQAKYVMAGLVLASALFTSLLWMALDPISLLTRTAAVAIYPAANLLVTVIQDIAVLWPITRQAAIWADETLRGSLLPLAPTIYRAAEFFGLIFLALLLLNMIASRFWCRYLCPLGGFLGLLARLSLWKRQVSRQCNRCGLCSAQCRTGAISPLDFRSDPGDCVLCQDCLVICPRQAISFGGSATARPYSPSRRQALVALSGGAAGVLMMRTNSARGEPEPYLVRPPGVKTDFLQRCIRCGECMKVCPTSVIQPAWFEAGLEGLWTPLLVPRLGYCEWDCTSCGQVCPTQAIRPLALPEKQQTVIGTAYIDEKRCIPWVDRRDCLVCEEVCPTPDKAIILEPFEFLDERGNRKTIARPRVVRKRCIGCGVCEFKCPVPDQAAIRVHATNEVISSEAEVITAR